MTLQILEKIAFEPIVATFNAAFSDYFVPIKLTKDLLVNKMTVEHIRLKYSVGAFDDGQLIGLILGGLDTVEGKKMAYNGGTGVVPNRRGKGITPKMYEFLLEIYRKEAVDMALLEVIDKNTAAIRSYEKVGFQVLREFDCVKGAPGF